MGKAFPPKGVTGALGEGEKLFGELYEFWSI